jgi:hypothetical protein
MLFIYTSFTRIFTSLSHFNTYNNIVSNHTSNSTAFLLAVHAHLIRSAIIITLQFIGTLNTPTFFLSHRQNKGSATSVTASALESS